MIALACLVGVLAAGSAHADCVADPNVDDEPGQKDLTQFCSLGVCGGTGTSSNWQHDDTNVNGANTMDGCALYDTDNDGFVNRAVCVTIVSPANMQAGNPKCYTCADDRPDRCTSSVLVACTTTCSVSGGATDPYAGRVSPNCNGTNCRNVDTLSACCVTPADRGGTGQLIDVCSYPAQNPNSDPSDCIVSRSCATNADCADSNPCTVDTCDTAADLCLYTAGNTDALCRAPAGVCDAPEFCTGTDVFCPADLLEDTSKICRNASDLCDVDDKCTGASADCPADGVASNGTLCRAAADQCDLQEVCNGSSKSCPPDGSKPNNTSCSDNNACTTGDVCVGGVCQPGAAPNCDDGNACTDDSCNPAGGCVHTNNAAPCSDGNACTSPDTCSGGSCVGGPAVSCNDNNVCTNDSCNPASGCVNANNTAPCDDGTACTAPDQCSGGSCVPGPVPNCNDNNACTTDSCDPALGCQHDFLPNCAPCVTGADCQNATVCDGIEQCVAGKCQSGTSPNCNDGNLCTDDGCNAITGCTHLNNNDPCNDTNACTTDDACLNGACAGGPPPECDDQNVCTNDGCNPASGCTHANNTASCNDGSECTTGDACQGGGCIGGPAPDCDDDNTCTNDACNPSTPGGCVHSNNTDPCDDTNGCTVGDVCAGGNCTSGGPKDCTDGNVCTNDTCNAPSGTCEYLDNANPCSDSDGCTLDDFCFVGVCTPGDLNLCNDDNICTTDSCSSPSGNCVNDPNSLSCDDNNACTTDDACSAGGCQPGSPADCDDDNPCTDDTCDLVLGCLHLNNNDSCDDLNACTTNDTCGGGSCNGGAPPNCNDNQVCTTDTCDQVSGCANTPNTFACDDGSECTTNDICGGGTCHGGPAPNCDDNEVCTTDTCNPSVSGGCVHTNNTISCDDSNACTTSDTCSSGRCVAGPAPNCNDGNGCTDDGCNEATGCTHVNNSAACNDNDACTTGDTCVGGACDGGPAPDCEDNNVCTDDGCNPASGCTHSNNTGPCSDGTACTTPDACSAGSCVPGPAPNCNDNNACSTDSCDAALGCQHDFLPGCQPCVTGADCQNSTVCDGIEQCVAGKCQSGASPNCNDGNLCTSDGCDPVTGCTNLNNNDPCNDTNACTTNDACLNGACTGGEPPNCDDNNVCTNDACNPASGCTHTNNTAPCNDNNNCTTVDTCSGGTCGGTTPPNCNDNEPCTDDTCNPSTPGGCVHTNNTSSCDDSNACTTPDTCSTGRCVGGPSPNCDDGNPCKSDSCNEATGCTHVDNNDPCNDTNACTTVDACSAGACVGTIEPDCNDNEPCTNDSCNPTSGCANANNTDPCSDGSECTTNDVCGGGTCRGGAAPACDDGEVCTTDTCNPSTPGGCVSTPNTGPCSDGNGCTEGDACANRICSGQPRDCADTDDCTLDSCDDQGGGFLCEHDNCLNTYPAPTQDCPVQCFPPCGNSVIDTAAGETCDPPNPDINPVTGQAICRLDCTSCGDGKTQTTDGETCDDGNTVEGCDPSHPQRELDPCKNSCVDNICDDPAKILLTSVIDRLDLHGVLAANSQLDFATSDVVVQITKPDGTVIFRASLGSGSITGDLVKGKYKYRNRAARTDGGFEGLKTSRRGDSYKVTLKAYGNLFNAQADMTTHIFVGQQQFTIEGIWEKTNKGWRLR